MKLRRAKHPEEVWACIDDELFNRMSEDGMTHEHLTIDLNGEYYFIIEVDGKDIGFWNLHPESSVVLSIHAHILKPYRDHSLEAGDLIVKWFRNAAPSKYQKLNADIPVIYPDVYHYTKKFGFHDEGINRKSFRKDGQIHDQYRLGLTRDEADLWQL